MFTTIKYKHVKGKHWPENPGILTKDTELMSTTSLERVQSSSSFLCSKACFLGSPLNALDSVLWAAPVSYNSSHKKYYFSNMLRKNRSLNRYCFIRAHAQTLSERHIFPSLLLRKSKCQLNPSSYFHLIFTGQETEMNKISSYLARQPTQRGHSPSLQSPKSEVLSRWAPFPSFTTSRDLCSWDLLTTGMYHLITWGKCWLYRADTIWGLDCCTFPFLRCP